MYLSQITQEIVFSTPFPIYICFNTIFTAHHPPQTKENNSEHYLSKLQDQMVFPAGLKLATIVPLPKNTVSCLNDFRSITLTPFIIKCLERLIISHIRPDIPADLHQHQFAY